MLVNKSQHHLTQRQALSNNVGGKGNSKHSDNTLGSPVRDGQSEGQSKAYDGNVFDNGAEKHSSQNSDGMPFNNPMDDADTLMRAILANYVEYKPGNKTETNSQAGQAGALAGEDKALADITKQFQSRFQDNASDPEAFHSLMQKSFGDQYDQGKAEDIRQQTLNGDFSWMPEVKLVDGATLTDVSGQQNGATGMGAYSTDNDTIYLSRDLLASDPAKAEEILTEEVGHALDARINTSDAAGDEGDIFSKLSHGEEISSDELTALRSENDSGTIMIDGREVEVEYGLFSKIKKGIKKIGKGIKKGVKKIGSAIKKGVEKIGDTIQDGIDKVKDVVSDHWKAIKKGFKKIMESELLGKIMMVAQFIPIPIVQVAVRVYNIAKAAYGVYQGVKHGSLAMIAGGVAGVAGGAAGLGKALGSTGNWINTAGKVANVAKGVGAAHQVIAEKNLGAAASLASNFFGADSTAANVLNTAVKVENVANAVKNDNLFGVVSSGTSLLQDFTGPEGDAFLSTINKHTNTIQQIDNARKTGNYAGAIGLVRQNFGNSLNIPQGTQETLQRVENGIRYAQTVDKLIDNKDFASAANMLLDTASSHVTNPQTKQNLQSLSNTITNVDNAVVAFEDGRFNDAVGFAADTFGQPLSTKARNFVDTVQSRANTAEQLVEAVKAKDVQASTALLRDLTGGKGGEFIDLIEKAGSAADKVKLIKNAVDNNDFSTAIGLASSLTEDVTGKASPDQVTDVQSLVKAVQDGDVQKSASLIDNLTNGKHSNVLNFIQTADNAVGKVEDLKRAIDNKDFTTAAALANSLSQDVSGRALPEQLTTAANLVDAVQNGDISGSSALLRELTNGKHSNIIDVFDKVGVATDQVKALETAIENKNFAEAAGIATSLSEMVTGSDSKLSNTLGDLSDVLSGKVQVPLNSVLVGGPGMTPGTNPAGGGQQAGDVGFTPINSFGGGAVGDTGFGDLSLGNSGASALEPKLITGAIEPRTPTAAELGAAAQRAEARLDAGDRAGAYIELYEVTGSEQLLLQAQITTYSGAVGGMALEGNFRAKHANPDKYKTTLDQFSYDIDKEVVDLATRSAEIGEPEKFDTLGIMEADRRVWTRNNVESHFPGNVQFMDIDGYEDVVQTPGSAEAILAQDEMELGRRPSEYANDPRYTINTSDDGRFTTVLNNETNRIEVFFDNDFESDRGTPVDGVAPDLEQLKDEIPSDRILAERQAKMNFVQAGEHVPRDQLQSFDENNLKPVANLDRVFEYEGKLYQVSDRKLFEHSGVEFGDLTDAGTFDLGIGRRFEGAQYLASLKHLGHDVDKMIEDRDYITDVGRERAFEAMKKDGRIVELTPDEVKAHNEMLESLSEQGLDSPYQSTSEAHKELESQLVFR